MKLLTRMLLLTILLLSIAAGLVALQPDHFQVRRSIRIQATPAAIFPLISRPRAWPAWTYWHRADPEMQRQYKGRIRVKMPNGNGKAVHRAMAASASPRSMQIRAVYYDMHLEGLLRQAKGSLVLIPDGDATTVFGKCRPAPANAGCCGRWPRLLTG
jgi:hypothetical protein